MKIYELEYLVWDPMCDLSVPLILSNVFSY